MREKLADLLALASAHAVRSPAATLTHLRTYSELLARHIGEAKGFPRGEDEGAADYLIRMERRSVIPRQVSDKLHRLRILGNPAAHVHEGSAREAEEAISAATSLQGWWQEAQGAQGGILEREPRHASEMPQGRSTMPSILKEISNDFHWGSAKEPRLGTTWPPSSGSLRTFVVEGGALRWPDKNIFVPPFTRITEIGYIETGPQRFTAHIVRGLVSKDNVKVTCRIDMTVQAKSTKDEWERIATYRDNVVGLLESCTGSLVSAEIKQHSIDALDEGDLSFQTALRTSLADKISSKTPYILVDCVFVVTPSDPQIAQTRSAVSVYQEETRRREIQQEVVDAEYEARLKAAQREADLALMSATLEARIEEIKLTTQRMRDDLDIELEVKRAREIDAVRRDRYKELLSITESIEDVLALEAPQTYWEHKIAQSKANQQLARAAGQLADLTNLMQGEKAGLLAATMRSQLIQVDETMRAISDINERRSEATSDLGD